VYGLVNQAVKELVLASAGETAWAAVIERSEVRIDPFLAMQPYPDDVTSRLVVACSEVLDRPAEEVLRSFGRYWIGYAADHGYGDLLDLMGDDLPSFLTGLDDMHDRLRLSFPHLDPPSIWPSDVTAGSLVVHYASRRSGLEPFLVGLLEGAAARFGETVEVSSLRGRADGHDHEEFLVLRSPAGGT
jgi:hypothetical protein